MSAEREFLEGLDDNLCDALSAAFIGRYDGMTVEAHLTHILDRLRDLLADPTP